MQSQIAEQVLTLARQGGRTEGSISGGVISQAIASLEKALAQQAEITEENIDEDEEQEHVSLDARAAPLREMLRHAQQNDSYVMWRPE